MQTQILFVFSQDVYTDLVLEVRNFTEQTFSKETIDFRRELLEITQRTFEAELGGGEVEVFFSGRTVVHN